MGQFERLLSVGHALRVLAEAHCQKRGQLHKDLDKLRTCMLVQEGECLLKGSLRCSMLLQSCPGAALAVGSACGSDHIGMVGPPGLGGLERLHCLAFHSCGERRFTQSQPQRSAALILLVKEIKGHVVMVHGLAGSGGTHRLCRGELRVGGSTHTVPTVSEVESELGELLCILLLKTRFQDTSNEAMDTSSACGRDLTVEVFAYGIMAKCVHVRQVRAQDPCLHSSEESLLDQFLVLTHDLSQQGASKGATKDGSRA